LAGPDPVGIGLIFPPVFKAPALKNDTGLTDNAQLKIQVNINPAFSQEQPGVDGLYDNVDVEFNDRSAQATSLNSG
jgi:hypothetical protein